MSGADGWAGEAHGHGDGHGALLCWTALLCHGNDKLGLVAGLDLIALTGRDLSRWSDGDLRRGLMVMMEFGYTGTHLLELEFSPPTNVGIGVEGRDDATSNGVRIHLEVTSLTVKFWRTLASTRTHLSGEGECVDGGCGGRQQNPKTKSRRRG